MFPKAVGQLTLVHEDLTRCNAAYVTEPQLRTIWYTPFEEQTCPYVGDDDYCGDPDCEDCSPAQEGTCDLKHVRGHHPLETKAYQVWLPWMAFNFSALGLGSSSIGFTQGLALISVGVSPVEITPDTPLGFAPLPNMNEYNGSVCMDSSTTFDVTEDHMVPEGAIKTIMEAFYGSNWNDDIRMNIRQAFVQHMISTFGKETDAEEYAFFEAWARASLDDVLAAPMNKGADSVKAMSIIGGYTKLNLEEVVPAAA